MKIRPRSPVVDAKRTDPESRSHRVFPLPRVLMVLAALAIGALIGVTQTESALPGSPAIAAAEVTHPTLETLVRFDFEPPTWGMPPATDWTHTEFGQFEVAAGASFTTDKGWYTCVDGPLVFTVLVGTFEIVPAGPAFVYTADHRNPPSEVSPGTTVILHPSDAIVYAAVDTASGRNPGSEPALALYGIGGPMDDSIKGCGTIPKEIPYANFDFDDAIPPLLSKGASISLQRVELQPFDSFVFELVAHWRCMTIPYPAAPSGLRLFDGAVEAISPNQSSQSYYSGSQLRYAQPGSYTLVNLGEEPVDFYFFVVEPLPDAGTPVA